MVLTERLKKEVDTKGILAEGQAVFCEVGSTIDNIYIL